MLISKYVLSFLILCFLQGALSKPTENSLTEGRGIGSTIWEWITYPFSWWSSKEDNQVPVNDHLIASTTYGPYDNIEVGKHNVTVWCNDQTCTTMKCDKGGCRNNTCNIYDTDLTGECREYHTDVEPEQPVTLTTAESLSKPIEDNHITESSTKENEPSTKAPEMISTPAFVSEPNKDQDVVEKPLELEAVLSSTVTEKETSALDNNAEKLLSRHNKM